MAPPLASAVATVTASSSSNVLTNNARIPHSLLLLTEYTSTLDTLPIELSRNFADLRELDAVLTASMANITAKVRVLIRLIEEGQGTPLQRLQLLSQISEEAERVKLGGDDKIKVASQAADNLKSTYTHMTTLLARLPDYDHSMLVKKTTYPHVSPNMFVPPPYESGRRRRAPNSGVFLLGAGDASPHKRRRVIHDEDLDYAAPNRTPRKDREGGHRQRARAKKVERQPSPADSSLSIASPMPGQNAAVAANGSSRAGGQSRPSNNAKRRNNANANANATGEDPQQGKVWHANGDARHNHTGNDGPTTNGHGHNGLEGPGVSANHHRGSVHNSVNGNGSPAPGTSGRVNGSSKYDDGDDSRHPNANGASSSRNGGGANANGTSRSTDGHGHGASGGNGTLEASHSGAGRSNGAVDGYEDGGGNASMDLDLDLDLDGDDRTYCICNCVSFGQMIGCDGDSCETEWFHLTCIGLVKPPVGKWYCDACTAKQAKKRAANNNRSKKRTNNRAGGKAVANA